jgi:indole-3-glycerol phosphate synthase
VKTLILDQLATYAKRRVAAAKEKQSLAEIKDAACSLPKGEFRFEESLRKEELSFICEVKKASPSKGVIDSNFPYLDIARAYEEAGADCVSCLTEPKWFLGSDEIFEEIRQNISLPMLRKDFTVDEYQLYEAKRMGADCVLLICALLDTSTIEKYLKICETLGLSALVETHDAKEIHSAISAGAKMIGVNNRNLKDFSVHIENAASLRKIVPKDILFVAESGIQKPADIASFSSRGIDAVLIGEALMRADDKISMLSRFREAAR